MAGLPDLPFYKNLIHMLDDDEDFDDLLERSQNEILASLTGEQRDNLKTLVKFFRPRCQDQSPGEERPKRGTDANNPWSPFMRMESFELARENRDFNTKLGSDGHRFLKDTVALVPLQAYSSGDSKYPLEQTLVDCLQYAAHLKSCDAKDKIRRLFCLLFFFDLARVVSAGPSGQIGHLKEEALMKIVRKNVLNKIYPGLPMERIGKWSLQGAKLNILCERFGSGCLFFLVEHLTNDFLARTMTKSGDYFERAMEHFDSCKLKEKAKTSRMNDLGNSMRQDPIHPFQTKVRGKGPSTMEDE